MLPFKNQMVYSLEEFRAYFLATQCYFPNSFKYEYTIYYDKVIKTLLYCGKTLVP